MIQFDKDKQSHAVIGAFLGGMAFLIDPSLSFLSIVAIAVGKEIYDYRHPDKHTADVADALVTVGAGALGVYITSIVKYFFF